MPIVPVSKERIEELRLHLRALMSKKRPCNSDHFCPLCFDLLDLVDAYSALREENERLKARDKMLVVEVSAWAQRSVKAERELAAQRPLVEAAMTGEVNTIYRAALALRESKGDKNA
jgi:hypothetical protein